MFAQKNNLAEKIRILLLKEKMTVVDLAKATDSSSQNWYNKLSRDNFTEDDLIKIAKATNSVVEINFVRENGEKI
ncbi:MAG: hypothetical protein ACI4LO_03175 [Anaerovoracaceae bacterium]